MVASPKSRNYIESQKVNNIVKNITRDTLTMKDPRIPDWFLGNENSKRLRVGGLFLFQ